MKAIYLLKYEVTRNEGYEQITACIYQINLAHVKEICGYGDMYGQSYITVYYTNGNEIEGQVLLPLQNEKDAELVRSISKKIIEMKYKDIRNDL